jgi:UDP-N-acetylglucosamine diphosphorylase/glucosamine-1-phosphate N-acetyltransferase
MFDSICLFEDSNYSHLLPLVYFRPTYDLRCGILTLREKVEYFFPDIPISLHCRNYLADSVKEKNPNTAVNYINGSTCLLINGRILISTEVARELTNIDNNNTIFTKGDTVVAAKLSNANLTLIKSIMSNPLTFTDLVGCSIKELEVKIINFPWDLISKNGEEIKNDFSILTSRFGNNKINGKIYDGVYLLNRNNIFIDEGTMIKPGVVLDAENGPIYIGKDAKIFPNAVIEGPAFIGNKSAIKIGAKIYENTSIGEVCKVGGEVEGSIIHSYSNKQHDGFLGHSYLGMWVNLGADTNNSDLKNNYGNIKVIINGEKIDSESMFVGLTIGDHSKSAINTMFNTGTVVGVSSNIYGAGFPKKYIPSFTWGGTDTMISYDLEKSIDVAKKVMARRNIRLSDVEEKLFREVYKLTSDERTKFGVTNY